MKKFLNTVNIFTLLLCASILLSMSSSVLAQRQGHGQGNRLGPAHPGGQFEKGFRTQLTDEQKEAVRKKIKELRDQGVTREEIHAAVVELLEGWGIEIPDQKGDRHGHQGNRPNLTDEQRETLRAAIQELRNQGATREEIRAAIAEQLEEWGIEPPKGRDGRDSSGRDKGKAKIKARNYPNPFNPETTISYTLESPELVKISIYNTQGQLIRTLVNEQQQAGAYTLHWEGRNENGQQAVSGVYFYRIDAGEQSLTQRMILIK